MVTDVAVDTNILIYAQFPAFAEHAGAHAAVERLLADRSGRMVLTVAILHELVHVVTDSRRFEPPLSMAEAIRMVRAYLGRLNVRIVHSDEIDLANALALLEEHGLGRQRVADTLLAATLRRYSVNTLWTGNVRDFQVFPFLEAIDPTEG
ncbi:MAG: PIN domain-containing protein [Armatimonadetes bacterium]|nr:PIN domain-containing protein [Armatimonadota bacterium]